ncbi:MAG: methylenetetrahydrofolate--tRNA-(uracil(54)-C(5))-methyltransferase (FADH(2)-oxidizing) TrmFO [Thermotogota bacterium]|nr:methylenetetrahydrofolate--tRNA-(uracil(54)-C(5))-methyltransferase (FADH(2)-oxidizing) TrmFO [Thermotogota bacterium]
MIVNIIGGGLAGSECALYLSKRGVKVRLFEMRPVKMTPVHQTALLSELVCSNSLKSEMIENASGMLKNELMLLNSRLLNIANQCRVRAGKALAVDRNLFSQKVTRAVEERTEIVREEITDIRKFDLQNEYLVVATGPLTSESLMASLSTFLKSEELFFFDAVSPIIESEEINKEIVFSADRYDQFDEYHQPKNGAYLNCPMDKMTYESFRETLINAECLPVEDFEKKHLFDRCQPIEEIAKSGVDAMRFGPLKPVGLIDPRTGKEPYALVQLRRENNNGTMYNLVGFQTRLKWPEQKKIIRMIPGLEHVDVLRYGVMHKNAYLNSPILLNDDFSSKKYSRLYFAGQITGVEGYVESIASGFFVGMNIYQKLMGLEKITFPSETMMGSLFNYCSHSDDLKPMYANFGLLPDLRIRAPKKKRRAEKSKRGLHIMKEYLKGKFKLELNNVKEKDI